MITMRKEGDRLFAEFPNISTQEWENVIQQDLKGADYSKKLIWKTDEQFTVKPYYRSEDLDELAYLFQNPNEFPFLRGSKEKGNDWKIVQRISESDPKKANLLAREFIQKGATAIFFNAQKIQTSQDIHILLNEIDLHTTTLRFENHNSYTHLATLWINYIENNNFDISKIEGSFDFDPILYMLLHHRFWKSKEEDLQGIITLHKLLGEKLPNFRYISVNGNILHNCGATIIQELAYSLSIGNEYLVYATDNGLEIDEIASKIQFTFSIGSNYFMEIAKLRVARMLWSTIVEAYNPSIAEINKMNTCSISSSWNKTLFDSNINLLRSTTEGMSAAIGGTNAILLSNFDETYKIADTFSQRLSRNIQIILKEEAHFNKVSDSAAGSYYIENLTHSIAREAWNIFLDTENKGGIITLGLEGKIKEAIEISCQKRNTDIAIRRTTILGTNQYPNINELMVDKIEYQNHLEYEGIQPFRGAIPFEEIRLATETWAKKHGRPKVFLFKIGNLAMRQARAGFITNFFGCAGYEIIETQGYNTVEEGLNDVLTSKALIVVICSSDEEYVSFAPEITQRIKENNSKTQCLIAGNPTESIDLLNKSGIDNFIHIKLNVLETLQHYNKLLGI